MGKSTISMAMFNSYLSLPEGIIPKKPMAIFTIFSWEISRFQWQFSRVFLTAGYRHPRDLGRFGAGWFLDWNWWEWNCRSYIYIYIFIINIYIYILREKDRAGPSPSGNVPSRRGWTPRRSEPRKSSQVDRPDAERTTNPTIPCWNKKCQKHFNYYRVHIYIYIYVYIQEYTYMT